MTTVSADPVIGRALLRLEGVDWEDLDDVRVKTFEVARDLAEPGRLRTMLECAAADESLVAMSERQAWGDRIVLFDDPEHGYRVRLHNWGEARENPHNHRWPFTALILRGQYVHGFYGLARDLEQRLDGNPLRPASVRYEVPGSIYCFDREMVHTTWTSPETVTLLVRGPADRDHSIMISPGRMAISYRKFGKENESAAKTAAVQYDGTKMENVLRTLYGWGVVA